MLDRDTEIHLAPDEPARVVIQEETAEITLVFDRERAMTGDAPLLEIRIKPPATGEFAPARLMPQAPLYLAYARATLARQRGDVTGTLRALRATNRPRRGMNNEFLRAAAASYKALVTAGESAPVISLAELHGVDKATASRWVSAARARGFLPAKENKR